MTFTPCYPTNIVALNTRTTLLIVYSTLENTIYGIMPKELDLLQYDPESIFGLRLNPRINDRHMFTWGLNC